METAEQSEIGCCTRVVSPGAGVVIQESSFLEAPILFAGVERIGGIGGGSGEKPCSSNGAEDTKRTVNYTGFSDFDLNSVPFSDEEVLHVESAEEILDSVLLEVPRPSNFSDQDEGSIVAAPASIKRTNGNATFSSSTNGCSGEMTDTRALQPLGECSTSLNKDAIVPSGWKRRESEGAVVASSPDISGFDLNYAALSDQPEGCIVAASVNNEHTTGNVILSGSSNGCSGGTTHTRALPPFAVCTTSPNKDAIVPGGWKRRNFAGKGPDRREKTYGKPSALEQALMKFADRNTEYIISPDIGTEFDSSDEAYEYYNLYSWEIGFGIHIGKTRYSDNKENRKLATEERYQLGQEFLCSCAGRPVPNLKNTSSRTNCPAKLRLAKTSDNGWIVAEHVSVHNHVMTTTYGEKKHWPSHSRLDKYTKDLVRMLRQNNIGITKLYSILGTFFGKMENVPTTKRCLKTLCQKINREQADDDIKKTLKLFAQFMKDDPGFKYVVDPDEEGRIKTLMWTNTRSIMQYQHFGDAITFDTTYKTNLYEMPFGLFVGVNNHFQSVLLGGVLMTDETIESFEWVFKNFAGLMGGKEPSTILTDQCRAMEVAIGNVWKNTTHRWCKWHVLKRLAECLGQKYTQNRDFRDKFHKILNEMMSEEEFELAWNSLLDVYGLQDNTFLKQIFATREMWVKSYFKDVFCARMTSTQRSESANMMLKNIVPPSCPLNVFVEQYSKLQYIRDEEESFQEKRSKLENKKRSTGGPIVRHASELYTPNVLALFLELKDESEFYKPIEVAPGEKYFAEHYDLTRVERWCKGRYLVTISEDGPKYRCECGLFEHFGLPCCHILRIMVSRCEQEIPENMILRRWTKKARINLPAHLEAYNRQDPNLRSQSYRHSSAMISALEYVEMQDRNPECYIIGQRFIEDGKKAMAAAAAVSDGMGLADRVEANVEEPILSGFDEFPQRAPKRRRERGRPSNRRDKPGYEGGSKRPRFCSVCQSDQHDKRTCPNREQLQVLQRRGPTCSGCGLVGHTIAGCTVGQQQLVAIRDLLV